MTTDDDLPLNVVGNPYDPIFAGRIAALGGRSGTPPTPPQPRKSGGGGGWGGGLLALIICVNLMRSCSNSTSSDYGRNFDHNSFRGGNPSLDHFPNPDLDPQVREQLERLREDLGREDRPGQAKPAGDDRDPDPDVP
jgi:hypothetical protein